MPPSLYLSPGGGESGSECAKAPSICPAPCGGRHRALDEDAGHLSAHQFHVVGPLYGLWQVLLPGLRLSIPTGPSPC